MRAPIPLEEHHEVFRLMEEMLPGLDSALVEELATDYLLEALICIDFDDLNYFLIRPGPFLSGAAQVSSAADFKKTAEQLLNKLLEKRLTNVAPSGVLIIVRSFSGLPFKQFMEDLTCVKTLLPEATECLFGYFYDPDGTEVKIRICLTGQTNIREARTPVPASDCYEDIPSFLISYQQHHNK